LKRPFSLSLLSLNFYPGTAIYLRALRDGLIDKESALQESIMILKNTYLNKLFLSLRYFEIPHFLVYLMSIKKIYNNKVYKIFYRALFRFLFDSDIPHRDISVPKIKKILYRLIKKKEFSFGELFRWFVWVIAEYFFISIHRVSDYLFNRKV
jgi:hypothetical protein